MEIKKTKIGIDLSYLPLFFGSVVTILVVYFVYTQTQSILKHRLQQRIESMVSIAALQLDAEDIQAIIKNEPLLAELITEAQSGSQVRLDLAAIDRRVRMQSTLVNSPILKVTQKMKAIREAASNVRYIYIWRKTPTPSILAFVTDSDTVYPVDWDGNGKIDDIEYPPMPGEEYDITDFPLLQKEAFNETVVQDDFIVDRWGTFLSGFAPIKDAAGNTVAIFGMDVEIGDFYTVVRATLLPFSIQAILLLLMLTIQTVALIRIWKNRVDFVKELDRQKDELLGIVSHQLAKPITAIKWNLESLMDGDLGTLSPDQKESMTTMQEMAVDLSDLVSMILDVSRIQLGKIRLDPQPLDLNVFFKEILNIVQPTIEQKKIVFKKLMPEKLPTLLLDKRYTRMTVENLLTNAVKYTPDGGTVTLELKFENGKMFCRVADTGCGIPKEDQSKIFDKMYRASNVRNTVEGNGFGLYVAKGAVEGQGGKMWFQSTEGKGTTFGFDLPMKTA